MTQISEAKKGHFTEQIKNVAIEEKIDSDVIKRRVASGKIVIPFNPIHSPLALGIGKGLRVKVNANIGTSREHCNIYEEIEKAKVAAEAGAHAVMDLSTGGNLDDIRKNLIKTLKIPFGTVPIYQTGIEAIKKHEAIVDMTEDEMFNMFEHQAKQGIDFAVAHVGVTKESVERLRRQKRLIPMVSRGGAFHMAWILHNEKENPLYKNFDSLLDIAKKYDVTLSLGDGMRSGALYDSNDRAKFQELLIIGELVERARERGPPPSRRDGSPAPRRRRAARPAGSPRPSRSSTRPGGAPCIPGGGLPRRDRGLRDCGDRAGPSPSPDRRGWSPRGRRAPPPAGEARRAGP